MCRACEWPRLILPVAVRRKRLAAPLCVLSFGITTPLTNLYCLFLALRWAGRRGGRCCCCCRCCCGLGRFGTASSASTSTALMTLGGEDDEHLIALHAWTRFDFGDVLKVVFELFKNTSA